MEAEMNRIKELAGKYADAQNKLSAQFALEARPKKKPCWRP
jgi:methyl-accepting chemotaxis protein